jgi:Cu/Ag efflux protein CusF
MKAKTRAGRARGHGMRLAPCDDVNIVDRQSTPWNPHTRRRSTMRKILGITLAVLLALSIGAWAADMIEGKIQSVDTSDRVFTLEDGTKVWVAEGLPIEKLKEGAQVKASYEVRDGKNVATDIEVSE